MRHGQTTQLFIDDLKFKFNWSLALPSAHCPSPTPPGATMEICFVVAAAAFHFFFFPPFILEKRVAHSGNLTAIWNREPSASCPTVDLLPSRSPFPQDERKTEIPVRSD